MGQVSERKLEEAKDIIKDILDYALELIKKAESKHQGKRFNFIEVDTVRSYGVHDKMIYSFANYEFVNVKYRFIIEQRFNAESIAKGYGGKFWLIIEATIIDMVYYAKDVRYAKSNDPELAKTISLRPFSNPVWRDNLVNDPIRKSKEVEDYYNDISGILEEVNDYIKMYHKKSGISIVSTYSDIRVYFRDFKGEPEQYREYFMDQYIMTLCRAHKVIVNLKDILDYAKEYGLTLDVSYANLLKHIQNKQAKGREIGPTPQHLMENNCREELNKKLPELIERLKIIVSDESYQKSNTPIDINNVIPNKKETYPDGAWYEGGFKNGARHGQGTFCWPNGIKYVGPFVNGLCHGEGILYHPDGTTEKITYNNGNIINRAPNIKKETYPDGAWYEGEFKNGSRHGNGTFCWTNGIKYVGPFINGLCHGEGILYYPDGTSKKVSYENGARKSIFPNNIRKDYNDGSWYEGELKNDLHHGQGIYRWSDGAWYQGSFENNQRHGQGTFCWANGDKYVGGWNNGSMHGNGIIYYNNGVKEEVICNNGNYISRKII